MFSFSSFLAEGNRYYLKEVKSRNRIIIFITSIVGSRPLLLCGNRSHFLGGVTHLVWLRWGWPAPLAKDHMTPSGQSESSLRLFGQYSWEDTDFRLGSSGWESVNLGLSIFIFLLLGMCLCTGWSKSELMTLRAWSSYHSSYFCYLTQ